LDVFGCFAEFHGLLRVFRIFYGLLRVFGFFSGLWMLFGVLFRCFAEQDRLTDVRTDCRAPAEDLGESSRSQGTTTKSGGDVCGGVKWAAPEIT
jgi:hypothetical protein